MRRSINLVGLCVLVVVVLVMGVTPSPSAAGSKTQQALAITSIEINQVLGRQYLNARNFVAGKDTIIRAYLNQKITVDYDAQGVLINRNGTPVANIGPNDSTVPTNVLTFACPTRAECGSWQAGNYSFEVYIGDLSSTTTAVFQTRQTLRVLAVPVKANYGRGVIKRVVGTAWQQGANFTRRVYPVAADGLKYTIGKELDGSAYDLSTDQGQEDLWSALTRLQPQVCAQNPRGPTCFEKIIGFIPDNVPLGGGSILQGYTLGPPANVVVASDQDMPATVAHEIGHNYLLGDEYNDGTGQFNCAVNPTPPTYVGVDFTGRIAGPIRCTTSTELPWPAARGGTGVLIRAAQSFPYEVGGRGPLGDQMAFMGSGTLQANMWVSPRQYAQLFRQLAPRPAQVASNPAADVRYVDAAGFISLDGTVRLVPWYTFEDVSDPITDTDDFAIEAVDGNGNVLASEPFSLDYTLPDQLEDLTSAPFEVAVEYPPATKAFQIKEGDEVLTTVPVTANAPVITITSPLADQEVSGVTTITWEASDRDGDDLLYDVEYSADCEDDFITLATSLTETQWEDDFSTLPGSEQACIWITATDGINSTDAVSDNLTVAAQAPEAFIETPTTGATFPAGERIPLAGNGYDLQDGDLFGDNELTWTSDKDGPLGGGSLVYPRLSTGTHTITLTATNSIGMKASTTVEVSIVDPNQNRVVYLPLIMR